jgi:hypothetical protein
VPDITNALVAEWKQVPAAMFKYLVESLPRRVKAVIAAKGVQLRINAHNFGMRCLTSMCPRHTFGHVVYFFPGPIGLLFVKHTKKDDGSCSLGCSLQCRPTVEFYECPSEDVGGALFGEDWLLVMAGAE